MIAAIAVLLALAPQQAAATTYAVDVRSEAHMEAAGAGSMDTRLEVHATIRVTTGADGSMTATVTGVEIEPTGPATATFAASARADTGAVYTLHPNTDGGLAPVELSAGAGPVARFLQEGILLVLPRRVSAVPVTEAATTSSTNQFGFYRSQLTTVWRAEGDSLVATITGSAAMGANDGSQRGSAASEGVGSMVLDARGVVRGERTVTETSTLQTPSGGQSSRRTTTASLRRIE